MNITGLIATLQSHSLGEAAREWLPGEITHKVGLTARHVAGGEGGKE